jgi:translation initiation factor IF-3
MMKTNTPKVNGQINAPQIRVVTENGTDMGVFSLGDAIEMAQAGSLDLIEVEPEKQPPVCRLMDCGRFKFQEQEAQRDGTSTI